MPTNAEERQAAPKERRFKLTGISRKGKNRVRELGEDWRLVEERDEVQFAPGERGPWLLLEPIAKKGDMQRGVRWVHANNDPDFTVQEIQ